MKKLTKLIKVLIRILLRLLGLCKAKVKRVYVFYDGSGWDMSSDDDAIAPDKVALLPGGTGSFDNVTSYFNGLNGIMVDIANPMEQAKVSDFSFKVGNDSSPSGWQSVPAAGLHSVTVREGAGVGGSDRIVITWADGAIKNTWLEVKVLASGDLGLKEDYVFYYGNLVGETGNSADPLEVTQADQDATAASVTPPGAADIENRYDHNRDKTVASADIVSVRDNKGVSLRAITP